jgi:hypothetical protein
MVMHGEPIAARVVFRIDRAVIWSAVRPEGAGHAPASPSVTRPLEDPPELEPLELEEVPPSLAPLLPPLLDEAPLDPPDPEEDWDPELVAPDDVPLDDTLPDEAPPELAPLD